MQRFIFALTILSTVALAGACSENPVGRRCFTGELVDGGSELAIISSPALECESRACLHQPLRSELPPGSAYADLCTAECSGDDDCDKVPASPCQTGFTCAVPVVKGPFCCRKMCICRDYVVIPDGGLPIPSACDPNIAANTCCNLPGRENEPGCQ